MLKPFEPFYTCLTCGQKVITRDIPTHSEEHAQELVEFDRIYVKES